MILQLNPPIPLTTPKGEGIAHFLENIGVESDYLWTVIQDDGEIWTWRNRDVRATKNITLGRIKGQLGLNASMQKLIDGKTNTMTTPFIPSPPSAGKIVEWPRDL